MEPFRASAFPRQSAKKQLLTTPGCVIRAGDSETDCSRVIENLVVVSPLQRQSQNQSAKTQTSTRCYTAASPPFIIYPKFLKPFSHLQRNYREISPQSQNSLDPVTFSNNQEECSTSDARLPDDVSARTADVKSPVSLTSEVSLPKK